MRQKNASRMRQNASKECVKRMRQKPFHCPQLVDGAAVGLAADDDDEDDEEDGDCTDDLLIAQMLQLQFDQVLWPYVHTYTSWSNEASLRPVFTIEFAHRGEVWPLGMMNFGP
jgi:hypothetical protein